MKEQLVKFAEELSAKFAVLSDWFSNKGIDPSKSIIAFINSDGDVVQMLKRGTLSIYAGECNVPLESITGDDILALTGYELLAYSTAIAVDVYLGKDPEGHFTYKNPFHLCF